jgi:alkylated DNA repair dioxygenase AlkB
LVKVISDENENRIFTFRKESGQQKDSRLILHPTDAVFILNSSSNFFILKPRHDITGITIIP